MIGLDNGWWYGILIFHLVLIGEAIFYLRRFPSRWRKVSLETLSSFFLGFIIAAWLWNQKFEDVAWACAFIGGLLQIWFSKRRDRKVFEQ
jgi:membrane associated rhomboid family serine protease